MSISFSLFLATRSTIEWPPVTYIHGSPELASETSVLAVRITFETRKHTDELEEKSCRVVVVCGHEICIYIYFYSGEGVVSSNERRRIKSVEMTVFFS